MRADAPSLDGFFPAGATPGTTNVVTVTGKFDPWPPKIWVQESGVEFTTQTNKGKLLVTLAPDAKPGPRLVRLWNEDGASEPRGFVVGTGREATEVEPNNHFAQPQHVTELPFTLNGRLDKSGDVDSFGIDLRAGQWLEARVDCYTLMSKVDGVLRLVTTNGQQLAWNHDFTSLDPRLLWRATNDGIVVLQFFGFAYPPGSEIALTGGESTTYRLHLAVTNAGPSLGLPLTEREPNNQAAEATPLEMPATTSARIGAGDDEDRFQIAVKKGQVIEARIEAAAMGSPLDAWLRFEDDAGNILARNDDAEGSIDPRLEWKATNMSVIVAVGSVLHRGGNDFCYRLTVREAKPTYDATLGASSLVLTPGATNELKVELKRLRGFTNTLSVAVRDLPAGVTVLTTNLADKEPSIKISAAADAPKFQGAIQISVRDKATGEERIVPFLLTTRGETGYSRLLVEQSDALWLTIRSKPAEKKEAPKEK